MAKIDPIGAVDPAGSAALAFFFSLCGIDFFEDILYNIILQNISKEPLWLTNIFGRRMDRPVQWI